MVHICIQWLTFLYSTVDIFIFNGSHLYSTVDIFIFNGSHLYSTVHIYNQRLTFLYPTIHIYIQRLTFSFNRLSSSEHDNMVLKICSSYKKIFRRGKS